MAHIIQQPHTVVVVQHNVSEAEFTRHRCTCCCCTCCKIHIACIVIMVFELIGIAGSMKWSISDLLQAEHNKENGLGWMVGLHGTSVFVDILMVVGIACALYAIKSTKPGMVYPHIAGQITVLAFSVIATIVTGVEVFGPVNRALSEAENEVSYEYQDEFGYAVKQGVQQFTYAVNTTAAVSIIIGTIVLVSFGAWFIYLFFQLKRYLEEMQTKIPGNYQRQIDGAEMRNEVSPPPEYKP